MTGILIALAVLFSVFGGASYYVAHRIHQGLVSFFPNLRFWPVLVVFLVLALVMILGFGQSMLPFSAGIKHILGFISSCYMGIFIYLLLFTAVFDLLTAIPRILKLSFTMGQGFHRILTLVVLVLTGVTCIYGFWNARQIDKVPYEIHLQDKADLSDLHIVMLSDLHLGSVGSENRLEDIVAEINAMEPDLICIAGDFFDTDYASIREPERAIATLKNLRSTYGAYACLGNHDAGNTVGKMTAFLEQANIHLLRDEYTVIDNRLILAGRLDSSPIGGYGEQKRKELSDFLVRKDPSLPVIVMDHNPANIHSYGSEVDLILCGHTHKGQLLPANFITGAMYAVDHGYYQKDSQSPQVIVTSGVGYWGMPMRVGTDCEIVSIRFPNND